MKKVAQSTARAEAKAAQRRARNAQSALEKARELSAVLNGKSKAALTEQRRIALDKLTRSKVADNGGHDYALDARRRKREDKPKFMHYDKGSDFGTRTATAGTKTDATINSYWKAKGGDNLPRS